MRRLLPRHALLACSLLVASAVPAGAHCCHDQRDLRAFAQSELRRGGHAMNEEPGLRSRGGNLPSTGGGLGTRSSEDSGAAATGGFGQLRGRSLGAYGAGSLGQRGPGGLGTLTGDGLGSPPPRPR